MCVSVRVFFVSACMCVCMRACMCKISISQDVLVISIRIVGHLIMYFKNKTVMYVRMTLSSQ